MDSKISQFLRKPNPALTDDVPLVSEGENYKTSLNALVSLGNTRHVSDAAYNSVLWDGVVDRAPSKNALRDKIVSIEQAIEDVNNDGGSFLQQGGGALHRSFTSKMREVVHLTDFIPEEVHPWILDGTAAIPGDPHFFDCIDAFEAAMNSVSVINSASPNAFAGGPEVIFPLGSCYFSRTIHIKKSMTLTGRSPNGLRTHFGTRLVFAPSITGIVVEFLTTFQGDMDPPIFPPPLSDPSISKSGAPTTIRNMRIHSLSAGVPDRTLNRTGVGVGHGEGHGIWMRGQTVLEGVVIQFFPTHGLYVRAAAVVQNTPEGRAMYGNCNLSYVNQCSMLSNGGAGIYIDGPDTNACIFIGCDSSSNRLSGIFESCFIGNTHIGHHTDQNGFGAMCSWRSAPGITGMHAYATSDPTRAGTIPPTGHPESEDVWERIIQLGQDPLDPNYPDADAHPNFQAKWPKWPNDPFSLTPKIYERGAAYWADDDSALNVFIGCYTEQNQPRSIIMHPSMVFGPMSLSEESTGYQHAANVLRGGITLPWTANRTGAPDVPFQQWFNPTFDNAHMLRVAGDGQIAAGLEPNVLTATDLSFVFDEPSGTWAWMHARSGARVAQRITTGLNTLTGGKTYALQGGQSIFPNGFWMGGSNLTSRQHTSVNLVPTIGSYAAGDVFFNAAPGVSSPTAWLCTTTGAKTAVAWIPNNPVAGGTLCTNDGGKVYVCIDPGTTANTTPWAANTLYLPGVMRTNFGNKYVVVTVGVSGGNPAWAVSTPHAVRDIRTNAGQSYNCIVAGTSASYNDWAPNTSYTRGAGVINGGNWYNCTFAGTSAASGGPTGIDPSNDVTDGAAKWRYTAVQGPTGLGAGLFDGTVRWTRIETTPAVGPSGTASGAIPDGTVVWNYVNPALGAAKPWANDTRYEFGNTVLSDGNKHYTCVDRGHSATLKQWMPSTIYEVGERRKNGPNAYIVVVRAPGGSNMSGTGTGPTGNDPLVNVVDGDITWRFQSVTSGPAGTGTANISDGSVAWSYRVATPDSGIGPTGEGVHIVDGTAVWVYKPPFVMTPLDGKMSVQDIPNATGTVTITPGTSPRATLFSGALAGNVTVTMSVVGAIAGSTFRVTRTATGAQTLTINPGAMRVLAVNQWADMTYSGTAWYVSASGSTQ